MKTYDGEAEVKKFFAENEFKLKKDNIIREFLYMIVIHHKGNLEIKGNLISKSVTNFLKISASELPEYVLLLIDGDLTVEGRIQVSSGRDNNVNFLVTGNVECKEFWLAGERAYIGGDLTAKDAVVSEDYGHLQVMGRMKTRVFLDHSWYTEVAQEAEISLQINEGATENPSSLGVKYDFIYGELKQKLDPKFFGEGGFFNYTKFLPEYLAGKIKL